MRSNIVRLNTWFVLLALLGLVLNASALVVTRTSDSVMYVDTSANVWCSYASYQIVNNDAATYSNLWVKIDSFTGGYVKLGGNDSGQYNLGNLAVGQTNTVFFYLQATNTTATAQNHTVRVYRGRPDVGTQLTNQTFSLTVSTSGQNNSTKINTVSAQPNPSTVGGLLLITIAGTTGTIGGVNKVNFTPAVYTNWDAGSYQLVSCSVDVTNGNVGSYSNTMVISFGSQADTAYSAKYWFRAVSVTSSSNSVSPLTIVSGGGGNYSHAAPPSVGVIAPILPATNQTVLSNLSTVSQLYTNEILTFTIRLTNSSTNAISLDSIVDTLPNGFGYVTNTSFFGGNAAAGPAIVGQTLTWSERYDIPAGTNRDFTFQATPSTSGYGTNSVIAFSKDTQIDTTINTSDNAPATSVVRVLLVPAATNDSGSTLEDTGLTVSAPGVLANDSEPNGFTMTVLSFTQPAHGSVTVSANGGYTYTPTGNYNGSDSFTYTLTNGNARASTATVNLIVTAVNDPPMLAAISNQTVNEDAGTQTILLTGITAGPSDESTQTIAFSASSSVPGLIANPVISFTNGQSTAVLSYTPMANSNGVATITVIAQDNGGTANGGMNAVTNTFTITVTAVNDAPSFVKGADQTVLEDAGHQTVIGWATAISAGPANESGQIVSFRISNNNSNLFSVQPAVSSNGTLTYTTATNANGSATVTLYAQDDGGTANGGSDSSVPQNFTITVTSVNDAPTLAHINSLSISQDAPQQTVNLSGISAGAGDETGQSLTVTATSSNPGLIPNPTVSYMSPNATASLSFTPTTGSNGVAVISVVVADNGGTVNGGVSAVTNTFIVDVGIVTTVWAGGDSLVEQVKDATGSAGMGYDRLSLQGTLNIQATPENPFTINLVSLQGSLPGLANNFDGDTTNSWTIVTASSGVTGFDPAKFVINTTQFSNDLGGGIFTTELSQDGNSVNVVFLPNHGPVALAATYGRAWGTSLRIPISDLISIFTSDADGDGRALTGFGFSTNGATISTNATTIFFSATNNFAESFSYVVRDLRVYRAGDTIRCATNTITISITNAVSLAQTISTSGNGITVRFAGVPGYAYDVERTTNLISGVWLQLLTTNAPTNGVWTAIDPDPPQPSAFYRTRQH